MIMNLPGARNYEGAQYQWQVFLARLGGGEGRGEGGQHRGDGAGGGHPVTTLGRVDSTQEPHQVLGQVPGSLKQLGFLFTGRVDLCGESRVEEGYLRKGSAPSPTPPWELGIYRTLQSALLIRINKIRKRFC